MNPEEDSKIYPSGCQLLNGLTLTRTISRSDSNIFRSNSQRVGKPNEEVVIPETEEDLDGLRILTR